ncbi:MAG: DALR domain-containing protein, partial [Acidimicrobiaceae bacterium]
HYRHEWEWTPEAMPKAHNRLQSWSQASAGDGRAGIDDVRSALDDDLNVPAAIAVLDDAASSGHSVVAASRLLGVEI